MVIHSGTGIKVLQWGVSTKLLLAMMKGDERSPAFSRELYFMKLYSIPFMIQPLPKHGRRKALRYTKVSVTVVPVHTLHVTVRAVTSSTVLWGDIH